MEDTYKVVTAVGEGLYKEKMSKFLSFALPATSVDEALATVRRYRNTYCDARHVCFAYRIGASRDESRMNDDGEPSGTAGRPILGQIDSFGLTNTVVIVVRYFGGIKLGTSGLIEAYKTAAREALQAAPTEERQVEEHLLVAFDYPLMGEVMHLVKEENATIVKQDFALTCHLTLSIRRSLMPHLRSQFEALYGATIVDE